MKFSIYLGVFFIFGILNANAEKTPEELSSTCLGCHGIVSYNNIYPTYKVPKLGNQHKDYIVSALKGYRSGERSHSTMQAHASNLSDSDIDKIAGYFSLIKLSDNTDNANIDIIEEANMCVGCHGVDGNSLSPTFPKIAGQYKDYLYHSLKSYQNGKRKNGIMVGIASTLNEQQIKKLSKYFSSQNGVQKINQGRDAIKD